MGIRVSKGIGYSTMIPHPDYQKLRDMLEAETKGEIAEIIRASGKLHTYDIDHPDCPLFKEGSEGQQKYPEYLYEVVRDTSYDSDNTGIILICPPAFSDTWRRYDDVIDYYTEVAKDPTPTEHFEQIPWSLNPYDGWLMKDGSKVEEPFSRLNPTENMMPMIPECVRIIATHIGLNWIDLRPVVATWWC